ncbi:MAG: PEP/pyruvate-binding domain-containing protein [Thermodesulfovibrionales bacterium]|nr:PEP/pyruvate-binding domain-containing protein [Thermodesulfovibrionales bacterium]
MKGFFEKFRKKPKKVQHDGLMEALRKKYTAFQSLLKENNNVLMLMADMEEKLSGEYLFDRQYINESVLHVSEGVFKIIEHMNDLSNGEYMQLYKVYGGIKEEISNTLTRKLEIPVSDLAIALSSITKEMSGIAGGKIAHLGEIKNRLKFQTPDGFSITAYAFKRFMEHNRLADRINKRLSEMGIDDLNELTETSNQIQGMVADAEIPADLQHTVMKAYSELCLKAGAAARVAVRSSAIYEDGDFSFAGQYATFLNVPGDSILSKYKEVISSLFTHQAIFYYKTRGFSEDDMVMAVGVLTMVDAASGGVVYTRDPNEPEGDKVIINAMRGLGKSVVDGTETPDSYIVSRQTGAVLSEAAHGQRKMLVCSPEGDIMEVGVPEGLWDRPSLSGEQIESLFDYAIALEEHYGRPQDIEWAVARDGCVNILQSRPLMTVEAGQPSCSVPLRVEGYNVLISGGVIACKGAASGKAFIFRDDEGLKDFPDGAVLVARHSSTKFVTVMNKASAIVTDVGSATGHMASLSREYGIPTILDAGDATRLIRDGQEVTVDAINCNIYEGRVEEVLKCATKRREPFKDTRLFQTLQRVLKLIVPLNLVDPDDKDFRADSCRTFHDITRFVHEMAMAEIFKTGKGQAIDSLEDLLSAVAFAEAGDAKRLGSQTSALKAGIPIDAHLLDIEGGIKGDLRKVAPEDIVSIPFSAFLRGLTGMKWPEPRSADVKGFLGMVAHTTTIQEEELRKMGGKSYAIVSRNYMNFSIRLGYHFSMVEAYAGDNINDNYIKFFFKGGGAATDRRLRRVRLITDILKKLDFRVTVIEDVIDANLTKYRQSDIEETLEKMGKLTVYTKQLDMAMYNDAVTEMFLNDFLRLHLSR